MEPKAAQHKAALPLQGRWQELTVCISVNVHLLFLGRDVYVSEAQKDSFVFTSDICLHQSHSVSLFLFWNNDSSAASRWKGELSQTELERVVHIRFSVPQCAKVANYSNMKGSRENHIHITATKTVNNVYICQHLISTIGVFLLGELFLL